MAVCGFPSSDCSFCACLIYLDMQSLDSADSSVARLQHATVLTLVGMTAGTTILTQSRYTFLPLQTVMGAT